VRDEVSASNPVGVLGVGAPGGSEVDGHGITTDAMGSSEDPLVGDDGATAPPASAESQTHGVGSLALLRRIAVGDATLHTGHLGDILGADDGLEGRGGGHGQSQNS